jgi:MFS family permease
MLGLETLPAVLYFVGLFFVPRSPRWLIMKGRDEEALSIMRLAVGEVAAQQELSEIQQSMLEDRKLAKGSIKELFSPAMRLVITIGVGVGVLQQATGINSVFFYAPTIFEQSGIGTDASFVQAIFVGVINLVFTLAAIALIDRLGRKPLLGSGPAGDGWHK